MKGNATAALSNMKANDASVMMMDEEEEENVSCGWMPGCWRKFLLPSIPPRLEIIMKEEDAPKSVRFRLDQNTTHHIFPSWSLRDVVDYQERMFVGGNEIHAAKLDMQVTARYFRCLYGLESLPNVNATGDQQAIVTSNPYPMLEEEVSTIGLEWLIWPDDQLERRQDTMEAIQFYSNKNSLARICQVISSVSKKKARQRAENVVQELRESPWSSANTSTTRITKKTMTNKDYQRRHGRWVMNVRNASFFQERRIPRMSSSEELACRRPERNLAIPKEIFVPMAQLCTTAPAAE